MGDAAQCPFCGFEPSRGEYEMLLHMETYHPDGASEAAASDVPKSPDESVSDEAKQKSSTTRQRSDKLANPTSPSTTKGSAAKHSPPKSNVVQAWRDIFSGHKSQGRKDNRRVRHKVKNSRDGKPKTPDAAPSQVQDSGELLNSAREKQGRLSRLGKAELGRHVNENRMPTWLVSLLEKDGAICNEGIIPALEQLLEQSPSTRHAYLCSPCVQHVSKLRREGSFCGYRNIQMLVSYIINSAAHGSELFSDTFPTIFQIQDLIEHAWDSGYNAQGRLETGGIKGTRKYIGTPEAQAVFSSLGIPCPVQAFKDKDGVRARSLLLQAIETYFRQDAGADRSKVCATALPPIYWQRQGHSMTIVGFERSKDGEAQLLVFDPAYRDSPAIRSWAGKTFQQPGSKVDSLVRPYRRGSKYLRQYREFELL